ncbi:developmentally regulated GTP-binding like protein [Babesia gibsoni]|uniref:Developmentally regulated GTP-binding like protein n=1 Tax=Babesia gibsoni TaxID=33632 RepID=A0AAD8LGF2_BABGI|nr:developmentally regulated GTP-binding like protein [Babesia gibsoni]
MQGRQRCFLGCSNRLYAGECGFLWKDVIVSPDRARDVVFNRTTRLSHIVELNSTATSEGNEGLEVTDDCQQDGEAPDSLDEGGLDSEEEDVTEHEYTFKQDDAEAFIDVTDPNNEWYERELIDRCKIMAVGGRGGNGCVSFRREKHVPLGGADGGNGGPGGSVYLVCDETMSNLNPLKQLYIYKAENGKHGEGERQNGAKGRHRYVPVPPGTHVYSLEGELYAVLQKNGDRLMLARGGRGGKGNRYYKTKFNVAPKISENGEEGIQREVILNYKIVGNVALIGKPNSGKSSILRCLSKARPRVADYAFSTKFPIVGVMDVNEWRKPDDSAVDELITDVEGNNECEAGPEDEAQEVAPEDEAYSSESTDTSVCSSSELEASESEYLTEYDDEDDDEYISTDEEYEDDDADTGDKYLCLFSNTQTPRLHRKTGESEPISQLNRHFMDSSTADDIISNIGFKYVSSKNGQVRIHQSNKLGRESGDSYTDYDSDYDSDEYDDDDLDGDSESYDSDVTDTFETVDDLTDMMELDNPEIKESRRQLVIADVPGLIEGASEGRGLGHKFLKHIENSQILAYVVDSSVADPLRDYLDVKNEVGLYNKSLVSRLELILLNKIDLIDEEILAELVENFKAECGHDRVYALSAKTRENVDAVKMAFAHIYRDPDKDQDPDRETLDLSIDPPDDFRKLNPRKFKVQKVGEGEFRILSRWLERKLPMMRLDQRETLDKLRRILRINRIHYKLKRMGVKTGDTIHIGDSSFCVNELAY